MTVCQYPMNGARTKQTERKSRINMADLRGYEKETRLDLERETLLLQYMKQNPTKREQNDRSLQSKYIEQQAEKVQEETERLARIKSAIDGLQKDPKLDVEYRYLVGYEAEYHPPEDDEEFYARLAAFEDAWEKGHKEQSETVAAARPGKAEKQEEEDDDDDEVVDAEDKKEEPATAQTKKRKDAEVKEEVEPKKLKPPPSSTGWITLLKLRHREERPAPKSVFDIELALLRLESIMNLLLNSPPRESHRVGVDPSFKEQVQGHPEIVKPADKGKGDACLQLGQYILRVYFGLRHHWATAKFGSGFSYVFANTDPQSPYLATFSTWWDAPMQTAVALSDLRDAVEAFQADPIVGKGKEVLPAMIKMIDGTIAVLNRFPEPDALTMELTSDPGWRRNAFLW